MGQPQPTAIGGRVAARRRQRGMSRRALAELVGRSEEWLRQVEVGHRRLDSLTVALRLAEVLHIEDLGGFLGGAIADPDQPRPALAADAASGLRRALLDHPSVGAFRQDPVDDAEPAEALERLWQCWWHSPDRYSEVSSRLPGVLRALRADEPGHAGDGSLSATTVNAYHLARWVLCGLGEPGLANLVADRGMLLAEWFAPQLVDVAAWHVATAYLHACEPRHALEFATAAARRIGTHQPTRHDDLLVWGSLHAVAARAAARMYEPSLAQQLLRTVTAAAGEIGDDQHHAHLWFGRAYARLTAMDVALRLGRIDDARDLAERAGPYHPLPPNLSAVHFDMLAHCYARRGESAAAVLSLLQLEQICPEEIQYSPMVSATLHLLLRRTHPSSRTVVARLARLAGL